MYVCIYIYVCVWIIHMFSGFSAGYWSVFDPHRTMELISSQVAWKSGFQGTVCGTRSKNWSLSNETAFNMFNMFYYYVLICLQWEERTEKSMVSNMFSILLWNGDPHRLKLTCDFGLKPATRCCSTAPSVNLECDSANACWWLWSFLGLQKTPSVHLFVMIYKCN